MNDNPKGNVVHNVTSNNQVGGVTAHTVHLEKPPRQIDDHLREQLLTTFRRDKRIDVAALLGDQESYQLAHQIYEFLKENGFQTSDGVSHSVFRVAVKGIQAEVLSDHVLLVVGSR